MVPHPGKLLFPSLCTAALLVGGCGGDTPKTASDAAGSESTSTSTLTPLDGGPGGGPLTAMGLSVCLKRERVRSDIRAIDASTKGVYVEKGGEVKMAVALFRTSTKALRFARRYAAETSTHDVNLTADRRTVVIFVGDPGKVRRRAIERCVT